MAIAITGMLGQLLEGADRIAAAPGGDLPSGQLLENPGIFQIVKVCLPIISQCCVMVIFHRKKMPECKINARVVLELDLVGNQ